MKKNTLSTTKKWILTGLVTSILATGGAFALNQSALPKTPKLQPNLSDAITYPLPYDPSISIPLEEYLQSFSFLSEAERQQLLHSDDLKSPHYEKMDDLYEQIGRIHQRLLTGVDQLEAEENRLWESDAALWDKFYKSVSENELKIRALQMAIPESKHLSQKEKDKLLSTLQKLSPLTEQISKKHRAFEKETEKLNKEVQALQEKIDAIDKKDAAIWDKINQHLPKIPVRPR